MKNLWKPGKTHENLWNIYENLRPMKIYEKSMKTY